MQWWDGAAWTENFEIAQGIDAQRIASQSANTAIAPAAPAETKVTIFNASKVAKQLDVENQRLDALIKQHGLLEVAELDSLRAEFDAKRAEAANSLAAVLTQIAAEQVQLGQLQRQVIDLRHAQELQEFGLYDFEHPAESSVSLSTELESIRSQIKRMVQRGGATFATSNFTFNNSTAKGNKFVKDMSGILLRAYNAEAENCIKSVRAGNLQTAQARLSKVREQIAKQGAMISLEITDSYHRLRLQELEIASRHLQAVQREKELERERRAELAEARKAEAELRKERERLDKEKSHYLATLAALEAAGDIEGAERMRVRLGEVEKAIVDVDYRSANIRAGYVYVISNIGAFGEHMVKIGMTRRLEPMDRVNELGDASVPFRFDVHALFFADDAIGIEGMLHNKFAEHRVNKVNLRREFFRVTPGEVLEALRESAIEVLEFTEEAVAPEFRLSGAVATAPAIPTPAT